MDLEFVFVVGKGSLEGTLLVYHGRLSRYPCRILRLALTYMPAYLFY
jgi:hypothetical protein